MINLKNTVCPLCKSKDIRFEDRFNVCSTCRFEFASKTSKLEIDTYYEEDIGVELQTLIERYEPFSELQKRHKLAKKMIEEYSIDKEKVSICDLGCGTGLFLNCLKNTKTALYGYDISHKNVVISQKTNRLRYIKVSRTLKEYALLQHIPHYFFDIITAFEVIEHVPDINMFVKQITDYLKPGGIIILSVPNKGRLPIKESFDYPPDHLSRFRIKNLKFLFTKYHIIIDKLLTYSTLGYYSNNLIHKYIPASENTLKKIMKSSLHELPKAKLLNKLSGLKKILCAILDLPLYIILILFPLNGHTIVVKAHVHNSS